jgi:hypothetical protein
VAVIDSGTGAVPDLAGKLLPEIDATGGTPACTSGAVDHGTQVAALIAAVTDNGAGIPGAGWETPVLPVRVFPGPSCTSTSLSTLVNAITMARTAGVRIINLSLTTTTDSVALQVALADAAAAGVVVVAAAGNAGSTSPFAVGPNGAGGFPSFYPSTIAVGSTGTADLRSGFSNYGTWVDLYAPGEAMLTYARSGTPTLVDGTSFAAPVVSGVVALLRTVRPSLTPAQIRELLVRTADPVGGVLRLDAGAALHDAVFRATPMPGAGAYPGAGTTEVVAGSNNFQPWARTVGAGPWSVLDGLVVGTPDVASSAPGTLDVVARGVNGVAFHRQRVGGVWGPWQSIGGQFSSDLTAASWGPGRLDVIGRGIDGALWHRSFDGGGSSGWQSLGGGFTSEPDVASWAPGRLDVFARGLDGAMWHRALGPTGWFPWESLGGGFRTGPGAASNVADVVHVAAVGLDAQVWLQYWNGSSWSGWAPLGGVLASSPDLVERGPGTIQVVARAADARLWSNAFAGGGFTGWLPLP